MTEITQEKKDEEKKEEKKKEQAKKEFKPLLSPKQEIFDGKFEVIRIIGLGAFG